jgi:hypothetical protein
MMTKRSIWMTAAALVLAAGGGLAIVGCTTGGQPAVSATGAAPGMLAADEEAPLESAGARLWAENCIRCHNMRTPDSLSDRQWEVVMQHMRVRANLTAREQEQILRFLRAAN